MTVLRLAVFCLLFCGTHGFIQKFFNFLNKCDPPQTLVGVFCAALFFNDIDGDGDVDGKDYDYDLLTYHWDKDFCNLNKWEVVSSWSCRYGYSADYGRWIFPQWDFNGDGVVTLDDYSAAPPFANADFLMYQYTRLKDGYCVLPNRTDPIDIRMCAEVNALKPEDIKCD